MKKEIIPIDGYNDVIHWGGTWIGSLKADSPRNAMRYGWKIMFRYEEGEEIRTKPTIP